MYGPRGAGVAERDGVMDRIDIIDGTLGKAYRRDGRLHRRRRDDRATRSAAMPPGFIFTTSLPPALAAGAVASIRYLKTRRRRCATGTRRRRKTLKLRLQGPGLPVMTTAATSCRCMWATRSTAR